MHRACCVLGSCRVGDLEPREGGGRFGLRGEQVTIVIKLPLPCTSMMLDLELDLLPLVCILCSIAASLF